MALCLRGHLLGSSHPLFIDGPELLELSLPALLLLLVHLEDDGLVLFQSLPEEGDLAVLFLEEDFQLHDARVGGRGRAVHRGRIRSIATVEILVQGAGRVLSGPDEAAAVGEHDGADSAFFHDGRGGIVPPIERVGQSRCAAGQAAVHHVVVVVMVTDLMVGVAVIAVGADRSCGGQAGPAAPAPVAAVQNPVGDRVIMMMMIQWLVGTEEETTPVEAAAEALHFPRLLMVMPRQRRPVDNQQMMFPT